MRIYMTSVFVDDQKLAKNFYTEILGFKVKNDIPMGEFSWLTLVSSQEEQGTELLLEPSAHPAVGPYRDALKADGIPAASFAVEDVQAEYERLSELGVQFTQEPMDAGPVMVATFDDTCGNLIQISSNKS
ncbi:MAG TPA: VOC family protein [Glutamicibacter sp.]|uniref:Glyoxalase family protein n=1 Tax=Glutamicibacter arilaitensis (strain DSM 16368 / CIP 108037 / IAM 15318 / JCM 13566 / NCIMB 14258 / Re117) TaxID=861360 RepID=A0ABP1U121_GLUAR|nr:MULTISPECIES: VOC family protein [Glutamicibacter]CBT75069.1 putative glyoxalase family protein [Glutamicibacter arilaitensis Re117]HCH48632.1 VOC family protein [Glutamicibacter sp.]HCJ55734.1 VOC family protein [Glutamicibacter sp.]